MVGYHLMAKGQSIQLVVWKGGAVSPPAGPGQFPGGGLEFFEIFFKYRP